MQNLWRSVAVGICAGVAVGAVVSTPFLATADETSTGDKQRILYSNQFTFTDDGYPLITIEIMSGQRTVWLSSPGGLGVLPDGEGGASVQAGTRWQIEAVHTTPAVIHHWTVVRRLPAQHARKVDSELTRWRQRGFEPRTFEVGTVFGVEGEVVDSRELLIAIGGSRDESTNRRLARRMDKQFQLKTSVHRELVSRPKGVVVARSGDVVIRNPSVLWFASRERRGAITVDDVLVGTGGSQLRTHRENRRYWGLVYVTLDNSGELTVANAVSVDQLLAGLVPAEMFASAPRAALAAQAIAARTELLEKIGTRHLTDPFLLCSSQHCQVYAGAGKEHPRTTRAVRNTRGMVMLRKHGHGLVDARYSAACGGHGEHNENVWGGSADTSLRGGLDLLHNARKPLFEGGIDKRNLHAFLDAGAHGFACAQVPYAKGRHRWVKRMEAAVLSRRVAAKYPGLGRVIALAPLERGVSGRIRAIRITGERSARVVTGDLHIRRLLGGLRSTLFAVHPEGPRNRPNAFEFTGAGFGHGVGMCQLGAMGLAQNGVGFRKILTHYYRDSRIRKLY